MGKGAVHFTGSNFACRRRLRWDILDRMRKLVENGTYERPRWLEWVERAPPLETRNILHSDRVIKNPYIPLVATLLKKYPHLRFEQCYNPENKWSKGHDEYAADHPVMQFVSHQLSLMNQGMPKNEAFKKTEAVFYKKRLEIERNIKVAMALGLDQGAEPLYTTGKNSTRALQVFDACKGGTDKAKEGETITIRGINRLREVYQNVIA